MACLKKYLHFVVTQQALRFNKHFKKIKSQLLKQQFKSIHRPFAINIGLKTRKLRW